VKVIDLFCGGGGFSEGFRQAGFEIILGIDNDFFASESFRINQNCMVENKEIREMLILPQTDIIIGSPPCIEFSTMNRNFDKERNLDLINKFLDLIKKSSPKYWIMENVPKILNYISSEYTRAYQILQANDFGLFHQRKRIFIGNFPKVGKEFMNHKKIIYPTPLASDNRPHASKKYPNKSCLTDYFNYVPNVDVFKKIMGFPHDYIFIGNKGEQIKQIGNAVCPPVSKAIAEAILKEEDKK